MTVRKLIAAAAALAALSGAGAATAAATPMNVLVPAYRDPATSAGATVWSTLATQSAVIPNRLVAIADVDDDGPGPVRLAQYQTAIDNMHRAGGRVIGYVETYGGSPPFDPRDLVDDWYSFYPNIDGIFFDEMSNTAGNEAWYRGLYDYVKSKSSSALVIGNPGTETLESYLFYGGSRVIDALDIFETSPGAKTWRAPSWVFGYDRSNFEALPYNVSSSNYRAAIDHAWSQNVGWIYVTNDTLPNPWDTLPGYFADEVRYIKDNYS